MGRFLCDVRLFDLFERCKSTTKNPIHQIFLQFFAKKVRFSAFLPRFRFFSVRFIPFSATF